LSDTYPWGLWILFDLACIAVAAGAFAMAGVIYVFQRKDLCGLGRTAVLTGLLSYSFVTVTLIADLGLPWHFYQLGLQAPEHSAMFEVSWCVGLYVTILLLEFLPVPFERWGFQRAAVAWRRWNGVYVAAAVTLFVYLLSRNLVYALATAVIFGALAWIFRARDDRAEPIMLAIAAVTLSTMHQSSLGSLYLLMPNMLASQWWSPVMPVSFFLSSIVAGTALVILIDMWIAKGWRRPLEIARLASVGQIVFWALLVYLVFRLGDMALRNRLSGAFAGRLGMAFAAEILLGGVLPLILLARRSLRQRADALFFASLLAVLGVTYNRMNVVLFAMTFRGRMPWRAPEGYAPSIVEWGDFDRPDRRDDLPLRPRSPTYAGSHPGGAQRGTFEPMIPDLWLEAHSYLRPRLTSSTLAFPAGRITARTFSPVCRCCLAPPPPSISSRVKEWWERFSKYWPPERLERSRRRSAPYTWNCGANPRFRAALRTFCWATRRSDRRSPDCCVIWRGRRQRGSSGPW
jgi:Ni/Fe-hydrogenase subunit HybB-like protein